MKLVVEIKGGCLVSVRSDTPGVTLLVVDRDFEGMEFEGEECSVEAHQATLDVSGTEAASAIARAAE